MMEEYAQLNGNEDGPGQGRFILDYMAEKVLLRQSRPAQDFLLKTSILSSFNASLCDALTGRRGQASFLLKKLSRAGILLEAGPEPGWYAYPHLLAEYLRARLRQSQPDLYQELHRQASRWYEAQDHYGAALEHSLAAGDYQQAARQIEAARRDNNCLGPGWLKALQMLPAVASGSGEPALQTVSGSSNQPENDEAGLVEALSERELVVLKYLAQGLSSQAIADRLVVAVSTVNWHLKNIYGKLGVHSRTQALARAHFFLK